MAGRLESARHNRQAIDTGIVGAHGDDDRCRLVTCSSPWAPIPWFTPHAPATWYAWHLCRHGLSSAGPSLILSLELELQTERLLHQGGATSGVPLGDQLVEQSSVLRADPLQRDRFRRQSVPAVA